MENHLRKPRKKESSYLEFFGVTGCGKTTVSHLVAEQLRKKGFCVLEPNYDIVKRHGKAARITLKCLQTLSYLLMHAAQITDILTIVKENGYVSLGAAAAQVINIVQKLRVYNKRAPQKGFVIWDQGIVQAAVSLSVNRKISCDKNIQSLMGLIKDEKKITLVRIDVDPQIAFQRMQKRQTKDSRIEKLNSEEEKLAMADAFQSACDSIVLRAGDIFCDNNGRPDAAAKEIMGHLFDVGELSSCI